MTIYVCQVVSKQEISDNMNKTYKIFFLTITVFAKGFSFQAKMKLNQIIQLWYKMSTK